MGQEGWPNDDRNKQDPDKQQTDGDALYSCQKVIKYSNLFDVVWDTHELHVGNDYPNSKMLYRRVFLKNGKSIPCWVCEIFPMFWPVCIWVKSRRKAKARHQLFNKGMNVQVLINLLDYQSMPDGPYKYDLDYQGHWIKFYQLCALTQRTNRAIAIDLINIFCIFGPSSILQGNNGKEFSHGASKSHHVQIDEEVRTSWTWFLIFFTKWKKINQVVSVLYWGSKWDKDTLTRDHLCDSQTTSFRVKQWCGEMKHDNGGENCKPNAWE
jgi:hypothetical protein